MGACATKFQKDNIPDTQVKYNYTFPKSNKKKERVPDEEKDLEEEERVNHEPIPVAAIIEDDDDNKTKDDKSSLLDNDATRATPTTSDKPKYKGRKIVIIGAGPAGIHMATCLIKQGYKTEQIVILEKSARACGKSYTIIDKDNEKGKGSNDYEDDEIVHEMGTCYLHPEYHAISSLLDEYDPDNKQLGIPSRAVLGTNMSDHHEKKTNEKSASTVDYTEWALAKISELNADIVPKMFDKLPKLITSGVQFEVAIEKYIKLHQEIFGKQSSYISFVLDKINKKSPIRGFPGRPSPENMKRIDCSFLEFLQENKLQTLIPFFVYSQSCQGYGILDKIPAFYGLFWNTPELMRTVSELLRLAQDKPNVIVLTKGYQSLWDQMIKKEKLNIIYNCNITKLNRHLDDKHKKIEISYNLNVPKEEQKIEVVDIDLNEFDKDDTDKQENDNKENTDNPANTKDDADDDKDDDSKEEQNEEAQTENTDNNTTNTKDDDKDDNDKEIQNAETETENDDKDKEQTQTEENVHHPTTISDETQSKEEDEKVTEEKKDTREEEETKYQQDDEKDIMIEADVLFLACGCKKALDSFWTDATEEERKIFNVLQDHTLCATLFEYDAQPELETHQTVVDVWPNITWKGSGQIYAYRNSAKCLMGHEKYDKLIKSGKIKRDRAVAYQYLNRGPHERELNELQETNKNKISSSFIERQEIHQETSILLLNQLKHDLEVWGETNINVIRQECWDYMPMWSGKDIQKQYPWIVKDELQGKYKKTFYIGSSVCFESVLNVVEYNYEICNQYCFDDPGKVFFCKKRIGSDKGPFAQDDIF